MCKHSVCIPSETHKKIVPPEFIKHLKSVDAPEGTAYMCECQVTGIPAPTISWYKDDQTIDNSPDYVITQINGTCCLKVRKLTQEHAGRYTCKANNQGGEASSSARLNVISKELLVLLSPQTGCYSRRQYDGLNLFVSVFFVPSSLVC